MRLFCFKKNNLNQMDKIFIKYEDINYGNSIKKII